MNLQEFKKELLKDKEFKKEYERYNLEMEISNMLQEARIIKGITQEKLAKMINSKQSGIARAERGTSLPSLTFLNKIANAFKTNLIVRFGFMDKVDINFNAHSSEIERNVIYFHHEHNNEPIVANLNYETYKNEGGTLYA